jgi:uncharacterized protein
MSSFIRCAYALSAGLALLVAPNLPALSQDRDSPMRRCLSIADVNERIDCLESGGAPGASAGPASDTNSSKPPNAIASFDCRAARTSIERAICGDITLSDWDSRMGRLFQQALRLAKDRQSLLENQRLWLQQRDRSCGAVPDTAIWSCLLETTRSRAAALAQATAPNAEAAPTVQPLQMQVTPATSQSPSQPPLKEPVGKPSPFTSPPPQNDPPTSRPSGDNSFGFLILLAVLGVGATIGLKLYNSTRNLLRGSCFRSRTPGEMR